MHHHCKSNIGLIYVGCLSLHSACLSALEPLAKSKRSSNLSQYVWEVRAEVREMKMTRPYLIVVSICGLRQDVCLSVYLSLRPSVLLRPWRHVSCHWVETPCLQSACTGTDLIELRVQRRDLFGPIASLSQQSNGNFIYQIFNFEFPYQEFCSDKNHKSFIGKSRVILKSMVFFYACVCVCVVI